LLPYVPTGWYGMLQYGRWMSPIRRNSVVQWLGAMALLVATVEPLAAEVPRRVASFNLCADQLGVALADPDQVVGLSPYASDPRISVVADKARAFARLPLQAEALVPHQPDLVLVGTWDRPLAQRMLRGLGFRVIGVDVMNDVGAARAQ